MLDAAIYRTRPVVLTALATVLAMVPLTRSVFWGPMAIAIMGGLTVATLLTIFFVPALYAAWFKVRRQPAGGTDPAPGDVVLARLMDRLQSMKVFEQVVAENGFAAGARKLGLSPATVTRLVRTWSLGVRLLQRSTRRLALPGRRGLPRPRARHPRRHR